MARSGDLHFDPQTPPVIMVSLHVARVERYSRQLFRIWGYVGDYEVAIHRPAAERPTAPTMLTGMQVTRLARFCREKTAQIWGYVGDYEASVTLASNDGRVRSLVRLHKLARQRSETRTGI